MAVILPVRVWLTRCFVAGFVLLCLVATSLDRQVGNQPTTSPRAPSLVFDSEHICLTVVGDSLEVEGLYRFDCGNADAGITTLFYPFPRDSAMGGARMVSLDGRQPGGSWQPLRFKDYWPQIWAARWWIPLDGSAMYEVRAVYTQALLANYGRYIVTTTGAWRHPLRHARFEINLPAGAVPASFSFPFECIETDGKVRYVFEAENFRPDRDVIFTWRD